MRDIAPLLIFHKLAWTGRDALPCRAHEHLGFAVIGERELSLTLTSYNAQESRHCTSRGQRNRTKPDRTDVSEPTSMELKGRVVFITHLL